MRFICFVYINFDDYVAIFTLDAMCTRFLSNNKLFYWFTLKINKKFIHPSIELLLLFVVTLFHFITSK